MADVEKVGAVFKVLAAKEPVTWNKLSFWTKAEDVQFDASDRLSDIDNTVQHRLENIYGITDSPSAGDSGMCASSYLVTHTVGELCVLNIYAGDWSNNTESVHGVDYYTCQKELGGIILNQPMMFLQPADTTTNLPTDQEKESYNALEMKTYQVGESTYFAKFYIEDKPDITLNIGIKGVIKKAQ